MSYPRTVKFFLIVLLIALFLAACSISTAQSTALPTIAQPTLLPVTVQPTLLPTIIQPTSPSTLTVIPPNVKPMIDKNFNDPNEVWCAGGSLDSGNFGCQDGEYHLLAKGKGNIAARYDGNFKNFVLQAEMRLSSATGAYLGVGFEILTPEVVARENMTGTQGALINSVVADSPSAQAGLNTGDVIVAVNGKPITGNDLLLRLAEFKPNDEITLAVVKGTVNGPTAQRDVKVKLGDRSSVAQLFGAYGVVFRGNHDQASFYIFMIHADGQFQLIKWSPSSAQTLIPWTKSTAIKQGDALNLLQVVAQDTHLTLFVNNQQLASISDDTYKEGSVGPVALEQGHAVVSTLKVWELP